MGRTKRKRNRQLKNTIYKSISLEHLQEIISVKQWMNTLGWKNNSKLILKKFYNTGRGVASLLDLEPHQKLIEIPYHLLITCTSIFESEILHCSLASTCKKLKAQDLLVVFLILQKHKGDKSKWKPYLDTLPTELPNLPWLCSKSEFSRIPSDLISVIKRKKWELLSSWNRIKKINNSNWTCLCCTRRLGCLITFNEFIWAYIIVNTRVVYIQPDIVIKLSNRDLSAFLLDEPCVALCPFLDMFNHSPEANTKAELVCVGDSWRYSLTTLINHKKHQQIFISYGSYDNESLFCEYGFFVPFNHLDRIQIGLEEILNSCNIGLNAKQRVFIKTRRLNEELYVCNQRLSFNLKAVIFVIMKPDADWANVIYSSSYNSSHYAFIRSLVTNLIILKKSKYNEELNSLQHVSVSNYLIDTIDYWKYRIRFIESVLTILESCYENYYDN